MALVKDYKSNLFRSMPDNTGHLAIHVSETRCTIAVCSSTGVLTLLRSLMRPQEVFVHDFVDNILEKHSDLIHKGYESITVGVSTSNFTLLPDDEELNEHNVIDFLTSSPTRAKFSDRINHFSAKFVYTIPKSLAEIFEKHLNDFTIKSATRLAIEQTFNSKADSVLVFEDNYFDCITLKDEQLYSVNRHAFETPEDIIYYLGLALKDAAIAPEHATIIATGTIKKHSAEFNLLYRYFQEIRLEPIHTKIIVRPDYGFPFQDLQYVLNLLDANY